MRFNAESNKVLVGNGYDIPYFEPFDEGWIDRYTVIDANGDYPTWWDDYSGHAYTQAGPDNGSDDWLITPDIHFAPGIYTIAFRYWGGLPGYSEYAGNAFEVGFGQGTDPSKFKTVGKVTDIILEESQQKEFTATVKVSADGTYNVGIHDISPNNAYLLYIDSLSITQGGTLEVPDTVGSLRATADPDGDLKVNISFTAPTTNANGDALDAIDHVYVVRDDKDTFVFCMGEKRVRNLTSPSAGFAGVKLRNMFTVIRSRSFRVAKRSISQSKTVRFAA